MAQEINESLWYDFNHYMFVVKTMLPNVKNGKESVMRWLRVLQNSGKNIDEMKLRNDFMYYLVQGVQAGSLTSPFDKPPPNIPLMSMVSLLPSGEEHSWGRDLGTSHSSESPMFRDSAGPSRTKPEIIRRSPDGGQFLAAQPKPDVGAFCYIAVVTKKKN